MNSCMNQQTHIEERNYLAQLRMQQAQQATKNATPAGRKRKKRKRDESDESSTSSAGDARSDERAESDESSTTSSVDTHLDECEICEDGGGKCSNTITSGSTYHSLTNNHHCRLILL